MHVMAGATTRTGKGASRHATHPVAYACRASSFVHALRQE